MLETNDGGVGGHRNNRPLRRQHADIQKGRQGRMHGELIDEMWRREARVDDGLITPYIV